MPNLNFGQAPNLGAASSFVYFTADGAFNVTGASTVTGDVGNDVGDFIGFPPGTLLGNIHHADPVTAQAKIDLLAAYGYMSTITCGQVIGTPLGGGTILTPNVYCYGGAAALNGDLTLDGQNDPNALFIFKIGGAFATDFNSHIFLINSASLCNVYWQIGGEFAVHGTSVFRGTVIANGAIHLTETATLLGRGLSVEGAIDLTDNIVTIGLQPTASTITAGGPTTFDIGGSVILSGNIGGTWSNGATTPSITVTTSGDYFVTNTTDCVSVSSNHILVTVLPLCYGIPTLSEWGLIILSLLLLALGIVFIRRRQYSFALAGGADATEGRKSLFIPRSFFPILAVLFSFALLGFAGFMTLGNSLPPRDMIGTLISCVVLAYILQLLGAFRKK